MTGLEVMLIAIVVLAIGYFGYAKWLEKTWGIDLKRPTPAVEKNDGKDFSPASRWTVFAHQFTSITGAGPVTGPIIAAMFGWLPALLWMMVGGVFFGAVQDFAALYASVKNGGKSIGMIIEDYVGRTGRQLFLLFCWLFTLLVIAAFCDMVANTFNGYSKTGAELMPNAAAASISILYMFVAVGFGLYLKYRKPSAGRQFVVGVILMLAMLTVGIAFPIYADALTWRYVVFAYLFAASVMPMWLLKTPRDYLSMFLLIGMIACGVLGVCIQNPTLNMPAYVGFTVKNLDLFPILFVTVACGAVSGFHSLVSSGTSSKTVENEKDMLKVGYGAMILESLLAVLALCVAGAAAAADGTPAAGTPFQIFSRGVAGFFEMFGVPAYAATVFMTMCVSALALTSLDAVARIGRMSFQELFSVDDMEHAEGWRKLLCNVYFSTFITLVFGFILTKIGYANIWPLFGSANQLLSALVLSTLCVFLKVTGRSNKMLFPPLVIMLCVTFTALVQRLMAMVKAISNAAAVTIPAGETTWGAVFIANGLQLILAVLLIVLGLNIVFHSFSAYKKAEHNSEARA